MAGSLIAWRTNKFVKQSVNFFGLQDSRNYRETLFLDRLQPTQRFAPRSNIFSFGFDGQVFLPVPARTRLRPEHETTETLVLPSTLSVDGGADDSHFIGGWDDLEAAAL